ncbi:MAG: hypothetical protein K940chlam3_00008 [Chlamydiae bacterium]|nr:hypothetical protein [Chlamydiota bacterium]
MEPMKSESCLIKAFQYEVKISRDPIRDSSSWIKEIYIPSENLAFNNAADIFGKKSVNIFSSDGSRIQERVTRFRPAPGLSQKELEELRQMLPSSFEEHENARNVRKITLCPDLVDKIMTIKRNLDEAEQGKAEVQNLLEMMLNRSVSILK